MKKAYLILDVAVVLAVGSARAELHVPFVSGGNYLTRATVALSDNTDIDLINIPLHGFDITGAETNELSFKQGFLPRAYYTDTRLCVYDGTNYNVYVRDDVGTDWNPEKVIDGDSATNMTDATVSNRMTARRGTPVWVQLPAKGAPGTATGLINIIGQHPYEHISTNGLAIAQPPSKLKPSWNLLGFGTHFPIVLHGTATSGELQAVWNFPTPVTSLTGKNKMYRIVIPNAEGINKTYLIKGSATGAGTWYQYAADGTMPQLSDTERVVVREAHAFWFINPSSAVPTVTAVDPAGN